MGYASTDGALTDPLTELFRKDAEFVAVVTAWPGLPEAVRARIVGIVEEDWNRKAVRFEVRTANGFVLQSTFFRVVSCGDVLWHRWNGELNKKTEDGRVKTEEGRMAKRGHGGPEPRREGAEGGNVERKRRNTDTPKAQVGRLRAEG